MNKKKSEQQSWKVLSETTVHENPYYKIVLEDLQTPQGKTGKYFVTLRDPFIVIIAKIKNEIVFTSSYRPAIRKEILSLPMGIVDKDESIRQAALRELEEETGYKGKSVKKLGEFYPAVGSLRQKGTIVLVNSLTKAKQKLEKFEEGTKVILINQNKISEMLLRGKFEDGSTLTALSFYLLDKRNSVA